MAAAAAAIATLAGIGAADAFGAISFGPDQIPYDGPGNSYQYYDQNCVFHMSNSVFLRYFAAASCWIFSFFLVRRISPVTTAAMAATAMPPATAPTVFSVSPFSSVPTV